jgi:hypothetical protein
MLFDCETKLANSCSNMLQAFEYFSIFEQQQTWRAMLFGWLLLPSCTHAP